MRSKSSCLSETRISERPAVTWSTSYSACANMKLAAVPVLFLLLSTVNAGNPYPDCVNGPLASNLVCNTSANFLDRAQALVNAMSLEEMVNNTVNTSPGVPRLGLPPYEWWSEALVSFFYCSISLFMYLHGINYVLRVAWRSIQPRCNI